MHSQCKEKVIKWIEKAADRRFQGLGLLIAIKTNN
jgi:hypothetical protein